MVKLKYKKFKLIDIFNWQTQKEIDPLKIPDLSINCDVKYPFYGQSTTNNGVISYESLDEKVLNNKRGLPTILIHSNNQNVVYLETPFYLKDGHGATSVLQADYLNEKNALYIITCIKKVITKKFSYNEKATKIALKNTEIELPVNENDELDLQYMESYIKVLEDERLEQLVTYLSISGLDQYELTLDDEELLKKYNAGNYMSKSYKISELFNTENGDFDIQQKHINGKGVYVVSSGEQNNGVIGKTDVSARIFNSNTITIDMFGNANFRDYKYKMVTHARVFSLSMNNRVMSKEEGLYFTTIFNKFKKNFSYSDMASWNKIKNIEIILPIDKNSNIDYEFINHYIKVQEKLSIKNLIENGI